MQWWGEGLGISQAVGYTWGSPICPSSPSGEQHPSVQLQAVQNVRGGLGAWQPGAGAGTCLSHQGSPGAPQHQDLGPHPWYSSGSSLVGAGAVAGPGTWECQHPKALHRCSPAHARIHSMPAASHWIQTTFAALMPKEVAAAAQGMSAVGSSVPGAGPGLCHLCWQSPEAAAWAWAQGTGDHLPVSGRSGVRVDARLSALAVGTAQTEPGWAAGATGLPVVSVLVPGWKGAALHVRSRRKPHTSALGKARSVGSRGREGLEG